MTLTRRQFAAAIAGTASALAAASDAPSSAHAADATAAGHTAMPAHWMGREQVAFVVYPQFTALDMVGPHHMLSALMGATVHVVARTREPVRSDTGLVVVPTATFDDCPQDLDILCVPGGTSGTLAAMQDDATLRFLRDRGARARHVTSVCTGALLLGAAGLLEGYRATTHRVAKPLLPIFGATAVDERVVRDRNRITGGGVTAGIDFGLMLVGLLRDRTYAECAQLTAEYAPAPPYDAGTPARAPAEVGAMMREMFAGFVAEADTVGRAAYARAKNP